jgi:hypothetical protein
MLAIERPLDDIPRQQMPGSVWAQLASLIRERLQGSLERICGQTQIIRVKDVIVHDACAQ